MTQTRVLLKLPLPTTVNKSYLHAAGRVILSPEARAYRDECRWRALEQYHEHPMKGLLSVTIHFYAKNGDVDGRIKQLLDALNTIVWEDDRQIKGLHVYQHDDKSWQHSEIAVMPFEGYPS